MKTPQLLSIILSLFFVVSLAGCGKSASPDSTLKDYTTVKNDATTARDDTHGEQTGFWYGAIGSQTSNGVAYIRTYEDGASLITVNLNILIAEKGTEYRAFLMTDDGTREIDIGEVSSIIGDVRHSGSLTTTENITGMTKIEVRHAKGFIGASDVVASGTLKVPDKPVAL